MNGDPMICCSAVGCTRQISCPVVTSAITGESGHPRHSFALAHTDGEWWVYRDTDGEAERVYCPAHHAEAS